MSLKYNIININRQKIIYDIIAATIVVAYILMYMNVAMFLDENANFITIRMRAFASVAFLLLHIILIIGPLTRLNKKFMPLLYNRRHLGIMLFILVCLHAYYVVIEYHKWGNIQPPVLNIFLGNTNYDSISQFPFQVLGAGALFIFFIMFITSHDFWIKLLSPKVWKVLHFNVYLAYVLVLFHVTLGTLQNENNILLIGTVIGGAMGVIGLHLLAAFKESKADKKTYSITDNGYFNLGHHTQVKEGRGKVFKINDERIAVFKNEHKVYALSNVCVHQMGPIGEGAIINGCAVCPWHGYQYKLEDGASPPPFKDAVSTYNVKIQHGEILLDPKPNQLNTIIKPGLIPYDE